MIQQIFYFLSDYFMNPFPLDCALLDETSKIFCQIIFLLKNSFWSTYKKKVKMESYAVSSEPVQKRIHYHIFMKFYYDFTMASFIECDSLQSMHWTFWFFLLHKGFLNKYLHTMTECPKDNFSYCELEIWRISSNLALFQLNKARGTLAPEREWKYHIIQSPFLRSRAQFPSLGSKGHTGILGL